MEIRLGKRWTWVTAVFVRQLQKDVVASLAKKDRKGEGAF